MQKKIIHYPLLMLIIILLFLTQCAVKSNSRIVVPDVMPPSPKINAPKVALVLGGGGARGFFHIGVIEVLQENKIPIDLIVGSSAGSAVGAIFADNKNSEKTKQILYKANRKELLDISIFNFFKMINSTSALADGQEYENFIFDNMKAKYFEELKIPLVVVAVDIKTGSKVVISSGPVAPVVRASSAVPFVMDPVKLYNQTLFDGGVIEPVPVITAKSYNPKVIIAVDINNMPPKDEPRNAFELLYRAFWLSYYELSRMQSRMADIDIHKDLSNYGTFDDKNKEELYKLGRLAGLEALPQIRKKLKSMKVKY